MVSVAKEFLSGVPWCTCSCLFAVRLQTLTPPPWNWASWPRWGLCRWVPHGGWWSWPGAWGSRREPQLVWRGPRWRAPPAGQSRSRGVWPGPSQSEPPTAASSEPGQKWKVWVKMTQWKRKLSIVLSTSLVNLNPLANATLTVKSSLDSQDVYLLERLIFLTSRQSWCFDYNVLLCSIIKVFICSVMFD